MKAIFIAYNQAYNEEIRDLLEAQGQRGFTMWNEIAGRGSVEGEPHYGDHAWPTMNNAIFTVLSDDKVGQVMDALRAKDEAYPDLGLRAYVMPVESAL